MRSREAPDTIFDHSLSVHRNWSHGTRIGLFQHRKQHLERIRVQPDIRIEYAEIMRLAMVESCIVIGNGLSPVAYERKYFERLKSVY